MDVVDLLIRFGLGLLVISLVMGVCMYSVLAERKVSSWIQGRVGPNRTTVPLIGAIPILGPFLTRLGIFQPLADGGKFLFKEDVVPAHVHKFYYVLAPIIAFIPALVTISVVPFGQYVDAATGTVKTLILANVDVGILLVFAVASLGVYSIIIAGWASNSKYPFLGGIRASAQMISYELAMTLSVVPVFMWVNAPGTEGTLSLVRVVDAQADWWFVLTQPVAAVVFLIALFAETNRLPFDMPESETDLVSGYHTEYSSFKFGFFFVGEYANMTVGACVTALVFFGGWHPLPFVTWADLAAWTGQAWMTTGVVGALLSIGTFVLKAFFFLFFFIWVRWTVPRFRYDQVMRIGWKGLLPVAIANLIAYALIIAAWDRWVS
ncbi:NADH-quinone oxidoreductase subunit NuoH [Opitutales bacterium ASA1]|uniref:NADH-quinone oxidoreductase subunit NuoH n=1 Tax=Congregicoccus parvus TaxID=3081749 RepID=UPI002B2DC0E4|nr:NADH-quinone oxidoreductase subunit NuoH [Opitutales bacterium ASA1]